MPELVFKLCPRCKRLMPVMGGATLCTECAEKDSKSRLRERDWTAEYAKRRKTEDAKCRRFYRSKEWTMLSRRYAHDMGYRCEECGGIGTDVHHVEPIQTPTGWERRFDRTNLRLLCVRCHNKAHGRTFGNGWEDGAEGKAAKPGRRVEGQDPQGEVGGADGAGKRLKVSDFMR